MAVRYRSLHLERVLYEPLLMLLAHALLRLRTFRTRLLKSSSLSLSLSSASWMRARETKGAIEIFRLWPVRAARVERDGSVAVGAITSGGYFIDSALFRAQVSSSIDSSSAADHNGQM